MSSVFKSAALIVLASMVTPHLHAGGLRCESALVDQGAAAEATRIAQVKEVEKILDLQSRIVYWKEFNGSIIRKTELQSYRRLKSLKYYLRNGVVGSMKVVDDYRNLFTEVESAPVFIKKNMSRIEELERKANKSTAEYKQLSSLKKNNAGWFFKFGTQYGEYKLVRLYLESVISLNDPQTNDKANGQVRQRAEEVMRILGINDMHRRNPEAYGSSAGNPVNQTRISMEELKQFFGERNEALLAKLTKDLWVERTAVANVLLEASAGLIGPASPFLGQKVMAAVPAPLRQQIEWLRWFGLDTYLREKYQEPIDRISDLTNPMSERLRILLEENDRSAGDELMYAFSRAYAHSGDWKSLLEEGRRQAEFDGAGSVMDHFYQRMLKAEERGRKAGVLAEEGGTSGAVLTAWSIKTTVMAVLFFYYQDELDALIE